MSVIRGTSLHGFPELVAELGGDPASLLDACAISPEAVGNPDAWIDYRGVVAVLELAAAETAAPDLGLRLAGRQGIDILGPVGVAARTAATVGAALQAADQYMSVYSPVLGATVDPQPTSRYAKFEWRIKDRRPPPHRQAAELGLGVAVRVFRLLAGEGFRPVSVHLRHRALAERADYWSSFDCPVRFSADFYGFLFRRSVLAQPLASDSAVHEVVRDYLNSVAVPAGTSTEARVRGLIQRMLPTGGLTLDVVASHLVLHPRALQRQLEAQGLTFAALVDDVRREEAERCLRDTDVSLAQLAGMLGYSEQSVLSRSCRRWFGASPSGYRRSLTR